MKNVPCNGCPDRYVDKDVNCHSDCSRYKEYKQRIDEKNATKKNDDEIIAYLIQSKIRHQSLKIRRKQW